MIFRCRQCLWMIDLPSAETGARALQQHHMARHGPPTAHEVANRMIEEEIQRSYAPRDIFGKKALPVVKGVTDRNAPKGTQ